LLGLLSKRFVILCQPLVAISYSVFFRILSQRKLLQAQ
jgi:hypothetical protein